VHVHCDANYIVGSHLKISQNHCLIQVDKILKTKTENGVKYVLVSYLHYPPSVIWVAIDRQKVGGLAVQLNSCTT
jgi:hypothetical protein